MQDYVDALKLRLLPENDYVDLARLILRIHKDELRQVFSETPTFQRREFVTISFLEKHSSFIRGNGFFSKDKPFVEAFKSACLAFGYVLSPRGDRQSIYFGFWPKSLFCAYLSQEIAYCFTFRFNDDKQSLNLKFGLNPETPENSVHRQAILSNTYRFHEEGAGIPIRNPGAVHVGVLKIDIPFAPMSFEGDQIITEVSSLFSTYVEPFVRSVSISVEDVLERQPCHRYYQAERQAI